MAEETAIACMLSSKRQATNEDDDSDSSSNASSNIDTDHNKKVEIKSLTVKFNNHQEIWRSPPTYGKTPLSLDLDDNKDDAFVWPEGWIEVLKYQSTNVSRSPRQQVKSACLYVLPCEFMCLI